MKRHTKPEVQPRGERVRASDDDDDDDDSRRTDGDETSRRRVRSFVRPSVWCMRRSALGATVTAARALVDASVAAAAVRKSSGRATAVKTWTTTTTTGECGEKEKKTTRGLESMTTKGEASDPAPPEGFDSVVREGAARALQRANEVFYNKPQVVNRDLSLAVIREFQRVRKVEHESGKTKRSKRSRGAACPTPKDDALLPRLLAQEDIDAMYRTAEEHQAMVEALEAARKAREEAGLPEEVKPPRPLRDITILEGMAATGLRSLRYAQELDDVGCVVANDLDPKAAEAIERNKAYNAECSPEMKEKIAKVIPHNEDVRMVCMKHEKMFDIVDLDPYGSPSILLDSAVQAVQEGGMLLVTATDMAVLCGNNGEVAWSKYGAYPLRAKYCHEMAVRMLLQSIENAAIKYRRHIVPVISLSIDFYIRVFVRVYTSPIATKEAPCKLSYVYQCVGCDSHELQPVARMSTKGNVTKYLPGAGPVVPQRCTECGWHYNMGGPIWSAPIHDDEWLKNVKAEMEKNKDRYPGFGKVHALLTTAQEELKDVPLHYDVHSMGGTLKAVPPNMWLFKSAIVNAGYRVSGCHSNPLGIKTDAPAEVLWDILRCWIKEHPVKEQQEQTPGSVILGKEPKITANWTRVTAAQSKARREGVARYPLNPAENWGPKRRAGKPSRDDLLEAKRRREEEE